MKCKTCGVGIDRGLNNRRIYCIPCSKIADTKTAQQRYKKRAKLFREYKVSLGCSICGYKKSASALDCHHIEPKTKACQVTAWNWKSDRGRLEMRKCILVCKNCHSEIEDSLG